MPNALLEAMACGLPSVSTRVGGVKDLVRDGVNGLLAEPSDTESLASAIRRILADTESARRMGEEARRTVEQRCAEREVVPRYWGLYRERAPAGSGTQNDGDVL
jgi:glycosyltransferase involved in cell wall biosynthesis